MRKGKQMLEFRTIKNFVAKLLNIVWFESGGDITEP